jgi:hypothetical protein
VRQWLIVSRARLRLTSRRGSRQTWASCSGGFSVLKYCRSSPVPDLHTARHRLRRAADLSAYARSSRAPTDGHESHPALPPASSTSRGRWTTVFFCVVRAALTSSSTWTLTGSVVHTHAALHQGMRCSWGTTWCPGQPSGRPSCLTPMQKPSIAPSPTTWRRPLGFVSCSMSSRPRCELGLLLRER